MSSLNVSCRYLLDQRRTVQPLSDFTCSCNVSVRPRCYPRIHRIYCCTGSPSNNRL